MSRLRYKRAWGVDPCDRCNPPICFWEHSITLDCGHGRNCGGVAVFFSAPPKIDVEGNDDEEGREE